ncbi:putative reverse transcriptase domain-containing protein [Tanacetum coccineum]|uniref:Reverse transcriptase domain-containing protein n=1 Tax=Tanacetum coccineum TaxID=301880 RepID=A0ABQ4X424_9ASTR
MLKACVLYFMGSWDVHLPLVEFSYNNSYHSSVRCASFEALYGRKCRSLIMWAEVGEGQFIRPELKKGKLAPRFVGLFEIIKKVGPAAYRLDFPEELNGVHDMFHVLNLKKHLADPTLQVPLDEIRVDAKLNFMEDPVEILEREFKKLKRSRIAIVKVWWNSKRGPEFTWEREDQMKMKNPHLFSDILYRVDGGDFVENYGDLWFIVINNPFWKLVGPLEEDLLDDEEKGDKDGDANDEGDDHISDTQDIDDEDAETEYDEDEISKPDVENSEEEEECYIAEADVSSLMDIHIQQETPQIQSPSLRVAKLKKDVSELKKIDLSAEALAALKIQGKKTKRRRTKKSESSKKPSTTKETPKGKAPSKGSKTSKSASAKESVEEPIAEVVMDDAGEDVVRDDDQPQDTSEPKTDKTSNPEWFKQPPRPPTPDPEWNKHQVVFDQPEQPWFNQMVFTTKDPLTFNDLMATSIDFSKSPGHRTVAADYFFNNHMEYLKSFDPERVYTTSITKVKEAWYEIEGIKDMVPTLLIPTKVGVKKMHGYGHLEEIVVKRADCQLYKFKEGDMSRRKWTTIEKKRSKLMVELIDKQMLERRIIQNLERLVGARELEMDYKLMARTI